MDECQTQLLIHLVSFQDIYLKKCRNCINVREDFTQGTQNIKSECCHLIIEFLYNFYHVNYPWSMIYSNHLIVDVVPRQMAPVSMLYDYLYKSISCFTIKLLCWMYIKCKSKYFTLALFCSTFKYFKRLNDIFRFLLFKKKNYANKLKGKRQLLFYRSFSFIAL